MTAEEAPFHGLPAQWLDAITTWAKSEPRIRLVVLFGSRARGEHRADSDVDLAVRIQPTDGTPGERLCDEIAMTGRWKVDLDGLLPVKVHALLATNDGMVVWPQAKAYGVLIYRRRERRTGTQNGTPPAEAEGRA